MKSKNLTGIIVSAIFSILILNFQFIYIFTDVNYYTQEYSFQNDSSKEINKIKSAVAGSLDLDETSTSGLWVWVESDDWITFEFWTIPSTVIEVSFVDETEWNTKPKDGIFTNGTFWGEGSEGNGIFYPSHEGTWIIVFRNPTYASTEVYYNIEISPLIILNPSLSTTAYTDSTLEITWKSNLGAWVNLELYKGNSFKSTLLYHTYNDGYASAYIPEDFSEGDNYKVKITDENSGEFDFSEQFSIRHPTIEIVYPFQDDVYIPHTTRSIIWLGLGINSSVNIELYLNSTKILQISNETSNDGEFRWTVWQGEEYAQNTYSTYQIQIKDINAQKYIGSSLFFTITKERYLSILTPTSNNSFKTGNSLNISWETDSTAYKVNIRIMQENIIIENITDVRNNGFYQWKIPSDFKNGTNYYLRIEAPDNSVNATSELFTIEYIPRLKVSGYNIPLFSIFIGLMVGIFTFRYKKKDDNSYLKIKLEKTRV